MSFNYYISTTGSDSNSGTSTSSPWAITSLQDTSANNSSIAGKTVGLMPGTYTISFASGGGSGNYQDPILHLPAGSGVASTYLASCDLSGNYSARTATVLLPASNTTVNSLIGQDAGGNGYFTIDGIIFDLGGTYPSTNGFSTASAMACFPSGLSAGQIIVQNCDWRNFITSEQGGQNVAFIFMQGVANFLITNCYFHELANTGSDLNHTHALEFYGCNGGVVSLNTFLNCNSMMDAKVNDVALDVHANYCGPTTIGPLWGFDGDQLSQTNTANVIHHNVFDGAGSLRNNDVSSSIVQNITFYNNTVYDTRSGSKSIADLRCTGTGNVSIAYNNILVSTAGSGNSAGNYSLGGASNISLSDYNCFVFSSLTAGWGQGYPSGATYNSLAAWQAFSASPDAHSLASTTVTYPSFASAITVGNGPTQYELSGGSPCINAGKTGGTSGGTSVNMGAYDGTYATIGANWVTYAGGSYSLTLLPGSFAFSGAAMNVGLSLALAAGAFAFTGEPASAAIGTQVQPGHFAFAGSPVTFTYSNPTPVTMPIMPNCVGIDLYPALAALQNAGIYVPSSLGYFGSYPISVKWVQSNAEPGTVIGQSPPSGTPTLANSAVTLTCVEYATAVAFP